MHILLKMTRRDFLASAALALAAPLRAGARAWPLGLNTYCLRFQHWNDRQLMDYCAALITCGFAIATAILVPTPRTNSGQVAPPVPAEDKTAPRTNSDQAAPPVSAEGKPT